MTSEVVFLKMPSRNRKKRTKQRAEYLQKQEENKAKARERYKADPEKKKASVRASYKADPEKKKGYLSEFPPTFRKFPYTSIIQSIDV